MRPKFLRMIGRVAFYAEGIARDLMPYAIFEARRHVLFQRLADQPEPPTDLFERVRYYNDMAPEGMLGDSHAIRSMPRKKSYYYFDLKIDAKHFGPDLRLRHRFGDVTSIPPKPTIVKSRPIGAGNANSVLMKLDRLRHFNLPADERRFEDKRPMAVWRGSDNNPSRKRLVERLAPDPVHDIGFSGSQYVQWNKPFVSVRDQLACRYIISVEGNDVATNLKWIMASRSLCMMPKPRFETWFMEGRLKPDVHYVELRDDFADLAEKVAHCEANPEMARAIIANANRHVDQFRNDENERLASLLVLQKYFECTGQIAPEPFSPSLYGSGDRGKEPSLSDGELPSHRIRDTG